MREAGGQEEIWLVISIQCLQLNHINTITD